MNKVQEMYETSKFDICIPLNNGVWVNSLDLVCRTEDCLQCCYSMDGISDDGVYISKCGFSYINENEIEKYMIENRPREILRLIQHMQIPEANVKYWHGKIKEQFSVEDYPEVWI